MYTNKIGSIEKKEIIIALKRHDKVEDLAIMYAVEVSAIEEIKKNIFIPPIQEKQANEHKWCKEFAKEWNDVTSSLRQKMIASI